MAIKKSTDSPVPCFSFLRHPHPPLRGRLLWRLVIHRHLHPARFSVITHTSTLPGNTSTFNVHGLIWGRVAPFEEVSVGQPGRQQSCLKMLLLATPTQRAIFRTLLGGWSETLVFLLRCNDPSVVSRREPD